MTLQGRITRPPTFQENGDERQDNGGDAGRIQWPDREGGKLRLRVQGAQGFQGQDRSLPVADVHPKCYSCEGAGTCTAGGSESGGGKGEGRSAVSGADVEFPGTGTGPGTGQIRLAGFHDHPEYRATAGLLQ